MSGELSIRQEILRKIWDSQGYEELMTIMRSSLVARDPTLAEDLKSQASACEVVQPSVAARLREMSEAVKRIHSLVIEFAQVKDMPTLLNWYRLSRLCFSREFFPLLDAFLDDATANDASRGFDLRQALEFRSKIVSLVKTLTTTDLRQEIEREPLLSDPAFHDFLEILSRALIDSDDRAADATRQIGAYLRHLTRLNEAIKRLKEEGRLQGRIRLPSTPELAELWFMIGRDVAARLKELADGVAAKKIALKEGVQSAGEIFAEALSGESPAMVRVYSTAALCEHLLRTQSADVVPPTIDLYKSVIEGEAAAEIEVESRATFVLRYAGAVVRTWRQLSDPAAILKDAVSKITSALSNITEAKSPRLYRDLLFTRARLLENLGIGNPEHYFDAEKDYRAGLAVKAVAHEAEARGRALGDLANTIMRGHSRELAQYDKELEGLYEEALRYLPADESPISRAVVLTSYAGHLRKLCTARVAMTV